MQKYIDINKDIINLITKSKEKFFVLIGENSSGKSEILMELEKQGFKTIDNFRFFDENAIKTIENTIEADEKIIIATHDIYQMFEVLYVPYTSVIIATFFNDLYDLASWGDVDQNTIRRMVTVKNNKLEQLLKKLLSIALFENWTDTAEKYFNNIDDSTLTPSQRTIYDMIVKLKNEKG